MTLEVFDGLKSHPFLFLRLIFKLFEIILPEIQKYSRIEVIMK